MRKSGTTTSGWESNTSSRTLTRRRFARLAGGTALAYGILPSVALPYRPKLTVFVVVEQFRSDYLDAAREHLATGGFRRLMENGVWYPDCRNAASTFTSSSLATLATGAWPSLHGIVADSWYDRAARRPVSASDESLLATTLAAQVGDAPRTRVFVIGMDGTATRMFAGASSARQFWMDERGRFEARGVEPDWLAAYNQQKAVESLRGERWTAVGARSDAPPLRTLVYDPARPDDFMALYRSSPFSQNAQFDFVRELSVRERLGQGNTTDFVCLLLGSTARLGYETGANSPLMQQMVLKLDRNLDALIDHLNRTPGEAAYTLAVAGAHGAPPAPDASARPRMAVGGEMLAQSIQRTLGPGGPKIEKYLYPFLYLEGAAARADGEAGRIAAGRAALASPAVANYYTAGGSCSVSGEWTDRFRNSFHLKRSGELMLSYRPEYIEEAGAGRGISYGSLYNYDVCVPLFLYGPQFRSRVIQRTVESVDIAPTLARVLGVAMPSSASGRILREAFDRNEQNRK